MSGRNNNFQKKDKKSGIDNVQEAQKLYKDLRRKRVPATLAVLICAAVIGFGAWTATRSDGGNGQTGTSQMTQEQAGNQTTQQKQASDSTTQQEQVDGQTAQPQGQAEDQEIQYTFRTEEQLEDHFKRHGVEMGFEDEEAYVAGANRVIASPDALHKLEAEDGDDVYYLEESNEFVVVSQKGYIRTYFEPTDGLAYYERQ